MIRVALVTGSAGGIGDAIGRRLIADGYEVVAVDLEQPAGGIGHPFQADLTQPDDNARAVDAAVARFGQLDVVVANAGVQHIAPVTDFPLELWNTIIALMLTSPFLLAQHAWPQLRDSPSGRFIAIASAHGLVASPFKSAYVAAKHGVVGLVKTLALEGVDDGITANAICPGYVRTPMVEKQVVDQAATYGLSNDRALEEIILAPHAVKALIEPDEVAAAVSFLAGPDGRSFTGASISMYHGWTAR